MKIQTAVLILILGSPLIYLIGWYFALVIDMFYAKKRNKQRGKDKE